MATAGKGQVVTGFIEGLIKQNTDTDPIMLPFGDKIGGATLNYNSENIIVETYSANGVLGASGSCPLREELSIELTSRNLAWSFLQAATNTLANDAEETEKLSVSVVLPALESPATETEYTLTDTPVTDSVVVADENGVQYDVTVSGSVITFDADYEGSKVTIFYEKAASGTNNEIQIGSGTKLGEIGVYGRFFGCPESILVVVPRANIQANLSLSAGGGDAAEASLTATALRDLKGNFGYLKLLS
jgi:hypothetical protein